VEDRAGGGSGSGISGIDPARESVLHKPMALHPSAMLKTSGISPFSGLWPFSRERREDEPAQPGEGSSSTTTTAAGVSEAAGAGAISEEPVELTREEETMISEDGKKIDRAVEAKRRTSIEDPEEDELEGGEEIIVHRAAGVR